MKEKILPFCYAALIVIVSALFISDYCWLFDDFSMMAKKRLLEHPLLTFFVTPFIFWISAYLCRRYSPTASGLHLPTALKQLEKNPDDFSKVSPFLNLRFVLVKTASSLLANFGGGALGREGPGVHISAGLFAILSQRYKKFLPKISLESWVLSGAAVGLATVFNAPFAAVMFVVERLSVEAWKNFKQKISATLFAILIFEIFFHKSSPVFIFRSVEFKVGGEIILLFFVAKFCGILAFFFKFITQNLYKKILNIESNWWHAVPLISGFLVALISFYCGIYSFGGGIETIKQTLASPEPFLSYTELFGRILNTILTFISGCAGGLIAPAMAIGVGIGSVVANMFSGFDIGIFLLVGMAAFLGAILEKPVTAAFIVLEVTNQNFKNLPVLIIAAATAFGIRVTMENLNLKNLKKASALAFRKSAQRN
jgi:H+/Cl- antiporter ClcA